MILELIYLSQLCIVTFNCMYQFMKFVKDQGEKVASEFIVDVGSYRVRQFARVPTKCKFLPDIDHFYDFILQ